MKPVSLRLCCAIRTIAPTPVNRLRSAIDAELDTTCSITAVSDVSRDAISDGRFSSKKPGSSDSRWLWTDRRRSATTRSPIQLTK